MAGTVRAAGCGVRMLSTIRIFEIPCRRLSPPALLLSRRRSSRSARSGVVCAAAGSQRVSFRSSVHTDLSLREFQSASFEHYMEDKERVFNALFPESKRRQRLNDDEWRIFMLPLDFFFLSVRPVVDMRVTLKEETKATMSSTKSACKLLTLVATGWELRGLDHTVNPSDFELGIIGTLYPEKGRLGYSRLKGDMELSVDLSIPPSLGLIPPPIIESVGTVLLSQVLENMKDRVNTRLLQDYQNYALQMQIRLSSA